MRLFYGIPLPETVQQVLEECQHQLRKRLFSSAINIKFPLKSQLHLTLHFLGEIDPELTPFLLEALSEATLQITAGETTVSHLGCFPPGNAPVRVVWAGLENADLILELHQRIGLALTDLGLQVEEREFQPHITLARNRSSQSDYRALRDVVSQIPLEPTALRVEQVTLFESQLSSSGASYREVSSTHLVFGERL